MRRQLPRHKLLKDAHQEVQLFRRRATVGLLLISLAMALVATRFAYLQVLRHDEFETRSEANRVRVRALAPNRGLIFDREGRLLADNRPAYRLELVPEQVRDIPRVLDELAAIVTLDEEDLARFWELRGAQPSFRSIPVRLRLTEHEAARFAVNRHRFTGVDIVPYETRVYPFGESLAHVLGYVGRITSDDLARLAASTADDASDYAATSHMGRTGIERSYERLLHGKVGYERVEINAQGRVLRVLEHVPPRAGTDLYLTIDAALQQAALAALGGRAGAIVVVDPASGEVLALASAPSFDPNAFVNGISRAAYAELVRSPGRPLFNRALQGGYEPGSTIKPYVALAGLELGVIEPEATIFSTGAFRLPGQEREYRDWRPGGHGKVTAREAISQSVNTFFYQLAVELGIDRMHDYLGQFGFGAPTGIDLLGEKEGILPSRAWKRATLGQPWFPGETVIAGIGQGFMVTTPLQLARAVAVLAARGEVHRLHLLRSALDPQAVTRTVVETQPEQIAAIDWNHWELVVEGMEGTLHDPQGTARAAMADGPGFRMAGKTGTAQVYGRQDDAAGASPDELPEHLRHHALFVGFAPVDAPQVAIAVVVEHGGSGSRVAAPVARAVMDAWFSLRGSAAPRLASARP